MKRKGLRKGFLQAGALAGLLAFVVACGVQMMPSRDPWYMEHYILMQDFERDVYKDLTDEGKTSFQALFWEARSPQSRELFTQRRDFVIDRFKAENSATPWNTDRARIYLLNGSPSSVDYKQTDSWGMQAQEQAAGGGGVSGIIQDRSGEDVQARSAEIWTYQYGQNLIQYVFRYSPPKEWKLATGNFEGNRYLGDFENENRTNYFGIVDLNDYKASLENLPKTIK